MVKRQLLRKPRASGSAIDHRWRPGIFFTVVNVILMVYHPLDDHERLLADKGYLEGHFKASYKMGYWIRELREQYDQALYQAAESGKTEQFTVTAYGNFNESLETIKF